MVDTLVVDTSVAIKILNGETLFIQEISKFQVLCLPVIVEGELLFGALNSPKREQNLQKCQEFVKTCVKLHVTSSVAYQYAITRHQLKSIGKPIPENDIWIASICIVNELPLATLDKHFSYIDKLNSVPLTF